MTAEPTGTPTAAEPVFAELLHDWDRQQAAYIADREARFAIMLDVLELRFGQAPITVIDLACGPASMANRLLDRVPHARVIGIDYDPSLLELARRTSPHHGDRLQLIDADLTDPSWTATVTADLGTSPHAAVSTTALHWLDPDQLVTLYRQTCELLGDGGLLLNGDHFRFDARSPVIAGWAARHDQQTQDRAFAAGAPAWDAWWQRLRDAPGMAGYVTERDRRFAERTGTAPTAVDFQLAALAQAGFTESGTAWQLLDDYVVYGAK